MNTDIAQIIAEEEARQLNTLNCIASENYPSMAVRSISSSILTAKYAEGYPGKRYYAGCQSVDDAERIAIDLAKKAFGCEFANVQPHSGSNANLATYYAIVEPGEKILAPRLDCGGHLTHGSPASITSKTWQFEHYGVDTHGVLDYEEIRTQAHTCKPKLIIAGTSAYPLGIDFKKFREIADEVGALLLADVAHLSGLILGGAHMSPFPHAHIVTTTTQKTLRGPRGGIILTSDADLAKKIDRSVFPRLQGGPHMHTILAKAQCLIEADSPEFKTYISQVVKNAQTLHNELKTLGCVLWTETTETHMTNIDTMQSFGISGKAAEERLEKMGIVSNRESLPFDTASPTETSGLRLGTPAMTTRGMQEDDMKVVAGIIVDLLKHNTDVLQTVQTLAREFPLI